MTKLAIPFDNPQTYVGHSGVDYPQPRGTTFRASGPGTVTTLGRNERGGFYIWVQYDGGPLVGYHHMDSHAGCPARWTRVEEGTRLGFVGNSGHSTGPHLHSEVSGAATTAGYWRFFDRTRVVGASAGGTTPPAASVPPESEEDDMLHLLVDDDGNGPDNPIWVLVNTRTSKLVDTKSQSVANGWATVWGDARKVERQEFLNALDAIRKTA